MHLWFGSWSKASCCPFPARSPVRLCLVAAHRNRFAKMTHYLSLIWCSGAPTPLSRMMKLPSPVPAVTSDGWTEHFLPPMPFTHIPDPTSGDSSAISGHINHPSCCVIGLKIQVLHCSEFVVVLLLAHIYSRRANMFSSCYYPRT